MGSRKGSIHHPRVGNFRWCFFCQLYKHIMEFYPSRTHPGGIDSICKSCKGGYQKDYQHQYYLQHRDELLPKHRISAMESYTRKRFEEA